MTPARAPESPFELGLMFTHRCPIACRHCGIESGPDNHAGMDMAFAEHVIDAAAALDRPPATIVFTGGEPMMYPDRLERLLERCTDHGLPTRVVTNGFWARSLHSGRRLLHRLALAGLDSLNFSADKYHLEFLEAQTFRNAVTLAREVGFPVVVNTVINETVDPVAHFCALYGYDQDEVRLFDPDAFLLETVEGCVPDEMVTKINLSAGRLVALGRAAHYPEEHRLLPLDAFSYAPCREVAGRPVVYPDGSLQACCCAGGKIAEFTVGNLHETPLADLIAEMGARSHYRFINRFGPRALFEAIQPADRSGAHSSICDVCVSATRGRSQADIENNIMSWTIAKIMEIEEDGLVV